MKLFREIKRLVRDENGAVTVDWVVLTAAIVGLGLAIGSQVSVGTKALSEKISTELSNATVNKSY